MAKQNSLRKSFHVKKLWFFSILKNRAQHEKIKTSQLLVERRIAALEESNKILEEKKAEIEQKNEALEQKNAALQKETTSLKNALTRQEKRMRKLTPQAFLRSVEIHLADGCNLKCFSCNHFSQLAPTNSLTDIDSFEKDMKRLSEITFGKIGQILLLGGEPLLNPNCKDFFAITRRYFPESVIRLVTNGILLPKQDTNFWESCRDNRIRLSPTMYPIKVDWDSIKATCVRYDVPLNFFGSTDAKNRTMTKTILDPQGKMDPYISFINCGRANGCVQLRDGKLFTCTIPGNIQFFNQKFNQNLQVTEMDYIDIYKAKDYTEILQFLSKPIPFCRYCNIKKSCSTKEWKISARVIEEYLET